MIALARRAVTARLGSRSLHARGHLTAVLAVLAGLALVGVILPAGAAAQTVPSSTPATWSTTQNTTPLISSISASSAGPANAPYLHTTYQALATTNLLGLAQTETVTSPTFAWTQATPSAITLQTSLRDSLGALVGVNSGITVSTALQNMVASGSTYVPSGSPTALGSQQLTTSTSSFSTISNTVPASLLQNGGHYEIIVTEQVAPTVAVLGSATIDLQSANLQVTPASPAAPVFTAGAPTVTGVTSSSANVNDTVDPGSSNTTVSVSYGPTSSYGTTVSQTIPANSGPTAVTIPLAGLNPSTTYDAIVTATNGGGPVTSSPFTFTTLAAPSSASPPVIGSPTVDGTPAERSATLGATIDTAGQGGSYYVQYGTSTAYGMTTSPQTLASGTTGGVPVSINLASLSPGTTYHARIVATDASGSSESVDIVFNTAAATPPTATQPTVSAANSTGTSVVVSTTVNPGATNTQVSVNWGTSTSYGNATPAQIVSGGNGPTGVQFLISGLTNATTYHFQVVATNTDGSATPTTDVAYTTATTTVPPVGPTSLSLLDENDAAFISSINPGGQGATYDLAYGTSAGSLNQFTTTQTIAPGTSGTQLLSGQINGLQPDTTYYAQFVVHINGQTSLGGLFAFHTDAPSPPSIYTTSFTDASSTTVQLQTIIDPGNLNTVVYANYGPTTTYGFRTQSVTVPAGSGPTDVTLYLTGLNPGTTYHVQLVTSNSDQTVPSPDLLFASGQGTGTSSGSSGTSGTSTSTQTGTTTKTGTTSTGTGTTTSGGAACVAAYVSASARALSLLKVPAGAEVTASSPLRIAVAGRTKLRGAPSYRLAGGVSVATTRRGFSLRLGQVRLGHTLRLTVTLPMSGRRMRIPLRITTARCGLGLAARRSAGGVALSVRTALGARRIVFRVPAAWSSPTAISLTAPTGTRTDVVTRSGARLLVRHGGRVRIVRSGARVTVSGLPAQTTGVTLRFRARGAHGTVVVQVMRVHGGARTVTLHVH